jgi:16S rRNA A1518/A1519 N6-dimethyltransferase RsmA/KsgA/DIM1 with predicted DNA glycosylase/AP lyase activity
VVLLEPRHRSAELAIDEPSRFVEFLGRCFRHKRKTLRNNLAPYYGKAEVEACAEASLRAEQITLETLADLYRRLVH